MSELSTFAAHARAMASAEHTPECVERLVKWDRREALRRYVDIPDPGPRPTCPGCVTDDDRARWAALADEVDAYLDPHPTLEGM